MNISATARSTTLFFQRQSPAWRTTAGVLAAVTVVAMAAICVAWSRHGERMESAARQSGSRQLFAGWVKPGGSDFGQASTTLSSQPKWVLATEPNEQEVRALQSALADNADAQHDQRDELTRLIEYSRFQKQVALWSELQNRPMDNERSTLSEHLLEVLPAHFNRGELMGPQALVMARALIKDIEPNPQRQHARLAEAQSRLAQDAPAMPSSEASEHSGTPQQLEAKLDAARRASLDPAPVPAPGQP